jgi:hypothetical protein
MSVHVHHEPFIECNPHTVHSSELHPRWNISVAGLFGSLLLCNLHDLESRALSGYELVPTRLESDEPGPSLYERRWGLAMEMREDGFVVYVGGGPRQKVHQITYDEGFRFFFDDME